MPKVGFRPRNGLIGQIPTAATEVLGFCFDTGHADPVGASIRQYLNTLVTV